MRMRDAEGLKEDVSAAEYLFSEEKLDLLLEVAPQFGGMDALFDQTRDLSRHEFLRFIGKDPSSP